MRLEQEARHDAEVAAAPAHGPEQVGMLALAGRHEAAVGKHHVDFEQVVDRQAVLAREVAGAAAERQPGHAGAPDDTERHREAERVGGMVYVGRRATRVHPHRLRLRIHAHALHQRQVDHQAVVAAGEPRAVVSAAANRDQQALVAALVDRGDHVRRVDAAGDHARLLVDHAVVEGTHGVVVGVASPDDAPAQALLQGGDDLVCHGTLLHLMRVKGIGLALMAGAFTVWRCD